MWNLRSSDKKYYESIERENIKRAKAISKASYRGEVSVEWHKTNKLTSKTLPEFRKLMKQADKEWELLKLKK